MRFSIDTRTIKPGEWYVAIKGARYDGHQFIPEAISKGAAGLIVEKGFPTTVIPLGVEVRQVANSVEYLASEAFQRISQLRPKIISVTGSVGKTTTKNAIKTVLGKKFRVVISPGNWNTLLGLSLTVLNDVTERGTTLVAEMALESSIKDIAQMCAYIPPSIGVVTNIHPVHIEFLGTIENIVRAKTKLVEAIPPDGFACLNYDDPLVREMTSSCSGTTIFYGTEAGAHITLDCIAATIPLLGAYAIYPALASFSVGRSLGLSDQIINQALGELKPEKGRLVKLSGVNSSTIIDDTYNAARVSTLAALHVLAEQNAHRRIAILGDMLELGDKEEVSHIQIVKEAHEVADLLILVGPRMAHAWESLKRSNSETVMRWEQSKDVVAALEKGEILQPKKDDVILIKGSAGMRMERIVAQLLSPEEPASERLVRQEIGWCSI